MKHLHQYEEAGAEPPLSEALNDPVIVAVMRRDRVTSEEIWRVIREVRDRLGASRTDRPAPAPRVA